MESILTGERFLVIYSPPDAEPLSEDEDARDTLRDLSPFGAEAR